MALRLTSVRKPELEGLGKPQPAIAPRHLKSTVHGCDLLIVNHFAKGFALEVVAPFGCSEPQLMLVRRPAFWVVLSSSTHGTRY